MSYKAYPRPLTLDTTKTLDLDAEDSNQHQVIIDVVNPYFDHNRTGHAPLGVLNDYVSHPLHSSASLSPITSGSRRNPFKNETDDVADSKLLNFEMIKIVLMTITGIAIIRFVLCILFLTTGCIFVILIMVGYQPRDEKGELRDIGTIRKSLFIIPQLFSRWAMWCLGYWWVHEIYPRKASKNKSLASLFYNNDYNNVICQSRVIVANHVSHIDALFLFYKFMPSVVIGASMPDLPILGGAIKALVPILVSTSKNQRRELPNPELLDLNECLQSTKFQRPFLIFPEATTKHVSSRFVLM